MSKPPPKPAKPGKSDSVTFCVFYSGPKSDVFPLRSTHLVAEGVWVWWAGSCTWKRNIGVSIDRLSKVKIKSVDADFLTTSTVSLIQKDTEKCPQCCLTGGVRSLVEGLCHFPISITHAATLVSSSGFRSEVQRRWWACRVWMLPVPLPVTKKKPVPHISVHVKGFRMLCIIVSPLSLRSFTTFLRCNLCVVQPQKKVFLLQKYKLALEWNYMVFLPRLTIHHTVKQLNKYWD